MEDAQISFPLRAHHCVFNGVIALNRGHFVFLDLEGSTAVRGIKAEGTEFEGDVLLRSRSTAKKTVKLSRATIGGNLVCDGGWFVNPETPALDAGGAKVEGNVLLCKGASQLKEA